MEIHGSFLISESPRDQGSLPPLWGAQVETHGLCPRIGHLFWISRLQGSVMWPLPSSPPDGPPLSTCHSHRCPGVHGGRAGRANRIWLQFWALDRMHRLTLL